MKVKQNSCLYVFVYVEETVPSPNEMCIIQIKHFGLFSVFVHGNTNKCLLLTHVSFPKHLSHTQIITVIVLFCRMSVKLRSHRKVNTYKQILKDFMSNMDTNAMSHIWRGTSTLSIRYKDQSWMMITPNVQSTSLQNVFRWTARCPSSSYSLFDTHIFLKVSRDARIEPPIQVEYKRSWGADI
jgi:hypothetical protein